MPAAAKPGVAPAGCARPRSRSGIGRTAMIGGMPLGSPLLAPKRFGGGAGWQLRAGEARATRAGALRAVGVCGLLFVAAYAGLWALAYPALAAGDRVTVEMVRNVAFASGVVTFAGAMATAYKPRLSPLAAPACSLFGGVFAGGLALAIEARHPGIAMQSIAVTTLVLGVLVGGYATGLIQVTARFRAVAMTATTVVALVYLASFLLWLVELRLPVVHGAGWGGVLWIGFLATVAALNFTVDLQRLDTVADRALPRSGEWYLALGTITTLVWLYISILRLLARIRGAGR